VDDSKRSLLFCLKMTFYVNARFESTIRKETALKMRRLMYILCIIGVLFVLGACTSQNDESEHDQEEATETSIFEGKSEKAGNETSRHVELINADGEQTGQATLTEEDKGVSIHIEAWDLPEGVHGFHIHDKGMCDPPTFESAGEHFNPTDAKHGFDHPEGPHAGDLPNLEVDSDGTVEATILNEMVTLKKSESNSLNHPDGTALVIHEKADDYVSQPAGDSGERIACGVITE